MASKDRAPSFQFYPRDYMADPDVQALSWERRGRYHWSLCCSALTEAPGIAPAAQWLLWMGYRVEPIERVRAKLRSCFKVEMVDGVEVWVQERMAADRKDQRERYERASAGARMTNEKRWGFLSHSDETATR